MVLFMVCVMFCCAEILTGIYANVAVVKRAFGRRLHLALIDRTRDAGMVVSAGVEPDSQRAAVESNGADGEGIDWY
jgi:hypothetical protein